MTASEDLLLAQMARRNWLILLVLAAGSLFWQRTAVTAGVVAGGMLVIINYRWLARSLVKTLSNPYPGVEKGFKLSYLLRLLFVASALYLLLVRGKVDPIALATGLSVVVINLLVTLVKRLY